MSINVFDRIQKSLLYLIAWVENNDYSGYDPYDGMSAENLKVIFINKYSRIFITQILKFFPINMRPFIGIRVDRNPKGIGLFLRSYVKMYNITKDISYLEKAVQLVDWLKANTSRGYSGFCWGYNFNWQNLNWFLSKGTPTIVNTSIIANAILDIYDATKKLEYLSIARSCCDFILNDLNITLDNQGRICFSYTPFDRDLCHNANLLGAELLSRVYSITGEDELLQYANKAFEFTLVHQNADGSWNYSINPITEKPRKQIDFHQGFILDSIYNFIKYVDPADEKYRKALLKGSEFYMKEQFLPDGRCKYRWPRVYPIDIHNQAQGIITFSKLGDLDKGYLEFAKKIALWTINNMQDESGYFYYQKWPIFTNKIPYMRWSQAWMMLALSTLMEHLRDGY